jgi:hypothetical protein
MSEADKDKADSEPEIPGSALARLVFGKLLRVARESGVLAGRETAYRDIVDELQTMSAKAEESLKRSPTSELLLAETMALRTLIAHFEPAPEYFAHKGEEHLQMLREYCGRIGVTGVVD